jgi:hypothetical protein
MANESFIGWIERKEFTPRGQGRTHQVILFTPGDRYHAYADRVVELQPI